MNRILPSYITCTFLIVLFCSCSKNDGTSNPADPTTSDTLTVDNKWECRVDGIMYSGSVDTSFITLPATGLPDTIITCNGTSADKKSNIHFRIAFSRRFGVDTASTMYPNRALFQFDTSTNLPLNASYLTNGVSVTYKIEAFKQNKIRISFSGTAQPNVYATTPHTITSGRFSCEIGKGNNEPKVFSFLSNSNNYTGYMNAAKMVSNTLVLEGTPYTVNASDKFKLLVRTGGTIQPGTYTSAAGNAGLQYFIPSIQLYYVNDTLGNLSVTIESVNGKIVTGSFNGVSSNGQPLTSGRFSCRVNNYTPQADSVNKWSFGADNGTYLYNLYGGNVLNAQRSQSGFTYRVTVNGESDNGASRFKLIVSSLAPITPGVYQTSFSATNRIDSLYFMPNPALLSYNAPTSYTITLGGISNTYCVIDSIDAQKIVGRFSGNISIPQSSNSYLVSDLKKGKFRANF